MSWPKGKPNPRASERMKRWHQDHPREEKPAKLSRSLQVLTEPERKVYDKLRRAGIPRGDALATILEVPY